MRSLADSLQSAVGDPEHTRQRTDSSTGQYSRPKKILLPPHRPNYVLHEVRFKRATPKARKSPESSPSATATIVTIPMNFVSPPWPARIVYLHDYYNLASIKLPYVVHYGDCDCSDPCQIDTCRNAQMNVFCTDSYCVWEELCANRPRESPKIEVKRNGVTGKYALVAKTALNRGEVLGEYLGRLRDVESDQTMRPRNEGYTITLPGAREKLRYPDLAESSDRLGGVNLAAMRDASKMRTYDEFEEANYTKQRRIKVKAEKAAADLKWKLARATQSSADSLSELVKAIMVLRTNVDREDRARGPSELPNATT
ncbi:hypothetical protein JG688_00017395 [Phytophthora aleatoria]|uniref:AWS domain-containing protein n=1 Tax=Phytophthora aleatoria TaxID=2496075 RepID=A0A8J5IQS0_9STRA|nr:hypothetical protein JG688_00017395 [Phytophthora aleatoria]